MIPRFITLPKCLFGKTATHHHATACYWNENTNVLMFHILDGAIKALHMDHPCWWCGEHFRDHHVAYLFYFFSVFGFNFVLNTHLNDLFYFIVWHCFVYINRLKTNQPCPKPGYVDYVRINIWNCSYFAPGNDNLWTFDSYVPIFVRICF